MKVPFRCSGSSRNWSTVRLCCCLSGDAFSVPKQLPMTAAAGAELCVNSLGYLCCWLLCNAAVRSLAPSPQHNATVKPSSSLCSPSSGDFCAAQAPPTLARHDVAVALPLLT